MGAQAPHRRASWHDAYDAQIALTRWYSTQPAREWLQQSFGMNADGLPDETVDLLRRLYVAESRKLQDADPIFVSEEMCELVEYAAESFEPEPLLPADLMTAHGFLLWERPFTVPDKFDHPTHIHAMSWAPIIGDRARAEMLMNNPETRGDLLRWFQERDYGRAWEGEEEGKTANAVDGLAVTIYATHQQSISGITGGPPVLPMHLTPWWFGMTFEGNEVDANGIPTGAAWWWKVAQTTLRLMQQRIAHPGRYRPDRASRRDARRLGFPDDRDVVVVRLRREKGDRHEEETGEANYSHRFVVSGHWRQQYYPSEGTHRQIWISPFIKGSKDLPLIWRPNRVYAWAR